MSQRAPLKLQGNKTRLLTLTLLLLEASLTRFSTAVLCGQRWSSVLKMSRFSFQNQANCRMLPS